MISKARATYVRMSPRKVRYVIDLVREKKVPQALVILDHTILRASGTVKKLINQAVDSASKQKQVEAQHLYVSRIFADGAGMMKRFRAMSMGRAGQIRKRMSHITVELDRIPGSPIVAADPKGEAKKAASSKIKKRKLAGAKK